VVDPGESESCSVEVELLYQPIGYRWAHNLGEHQADETLRFVGYYQAMADQSAIRLAAASTWITARPAEPPQVVEPPTESP